MGSCASNERPPSDSQRTIGVREVDIRKATCGWVHEVGRSCSATGEPTPAWHAPGKETDSTIDARTSPSSVEIIAVSLGNGGGASAGDATTVTTAASLRRSRAGAFRRACPVVFALTKTDVHRDWAGVRERNRTLLARHAARFTGAEIHPVAAGGSGVEVVAKDIAFAPTELMVGATPTKITLRNEGSIAHTLVVEGAPNFEKLEVLTNGASDFAVLDVAPGTYTAYYDQPGHRAAGMELKLNVS